MNRVPPIMRATMGPGPFDDIEDAGFRDALSAAINVLPEREKLVLSLYYDEDMNLREIGEVLEVSESRVCQIHGQALVRLRARLSGVAVAGLIHGYFKHHRHRACADSDHRRRDLERQQRRRAGRQRGLRHRGRRHACRQPGANADGHFSAGVENRLLGVQAAGEQSRGHDRKNSRVEQCRAQAGIARPGIRGRRREGRVPEKGLAVPGRRRRAGRDPFQHGDRTGHHGALRHAGRQGFRIHGRLFADASASSAPSWG